MGTKDCADGYDCLSSQSLLHPTHPQPSGGQIWPCVPTKTGGSSSTWFQHGYHLRITEHRIAQVGKGLKGHQIQPKPDDITLTTLLCHSPGKRKILVRKSALKCRVRNSPECLGLVSAGYWKAMLNPQLNSPCCFLRNLEMFPLMRWTCPENSMCSAWDRGRGKTVRCM